MSLDLAVARALHGVKLLERAVHEPNGWSIEVGGLRAPAAREVRGDRVVFRTALPELPFRSTPDTVTLLHDGEPLAVREYDVETEGRRVLWALQLVDPVGV
jgi:hypothetical protein